MKNNLLKQTAELMFSSDYKDRFVAEYIQLKVRYDRLKAFCNKIEAARRVEWDGTRLEEPKHDCSLDLLRDQERHMSEYLHTLEVRAVIEDIDLEDAMLYYDSKCRVQNAECKALSVGRADSSPKVGAESEQPRGSDDILEEALDDLFGEVMEKLGDLTIHICGSKSKNGEKKDGGKNG